MPTRTAPTVPPVASVPTVRDNPSVRRTVIAGLASLLGVLTLKGLLTDYGWIVDAWLTIIVVVAPTLVIRLWRPPGALDVWPGVILMIPWLTLRFVPDHAVVGIIPTGGTFHDLSQLMTQLHQTSSGETAPIHSTPAVRLVVCALIGLLAALIDLIAVVGHRSALAGIPLLVVYTISGAVSREAVAWVWFAAAAAGFLLLLSMDATDDRAGWGHRVAGGTNRSRDAWAQTAPRLAVIAIAVAVLLPFVLPVPSNNVLADAFRGHGSGDGGFGARDGDGGSISPFATLKGSLQQGKDENLMTVHVIGPASTVPYYLRTNVLDDYQNNRGWRVSDHGATEDIRTSDLQTQPGDDRPPANRFTAQITISGLDSNVPIFAALNQVDQVSPGTKWSSEDQLLVGPSVHRGQKIVEQVQQPAPTNQDLLDAQDKDKPDLAHWLSKPSLPSYVVSLVNKLTQGTSGPYAAARAISDYFAKPANGFVYSLTTTAGDSGSDLVDFLKNRQGYCQQYAAAMAIMLRQANVPSRVVLGYMHDAPDASGNFTVTSHDAHAWVEAYFSGLGWIPFDPTPIGGLAGGSKSDLPWAPHDYPTDLPGGGANTRDPRPTTAASGTASVATTAAPPVAGATPPTSGGTNWQPILVLAVVVVVIVTLLVPAIARGGRRRLRWAAARAGDPSAIWTELCDTAIDLGYVWSPARSPRQVVEWLGHDVEESRRPLAVLAAAVERQRYGVATAADQAAGAELVTSMREANAALRSHRSTRTRLASRLWPASLGWRLGARRGGSGGGSMRWADVAGVRRH